ncbi:MAG: glycosyl transferase family 28 [Actinomycetota bacterium]|nr:glycosyl transferase family 28 [Actinomycetota bacterium]
MAPPLVLVVVGTDHHPFSRLVTWMDRWARAHPDVRCLVQHGTAPAPQVCEGVDYLPHPELRSLMAQARAVVSHGGPGTIMEMRSSGHLPVVVPRDPRLGEHVDSHQQRFARVVADRYLVRLAETEKDLGQAVEEAVRAEARSAVASSVDSAAAAAEAFGALVQAQVQKRTGRRHRRFGRTG